MRSHARSRVPDPILAQASTGGLLVRALSTLCRVRLVIKVSQLVLTEHLRGWLNLFWSQVTIECAERGLLFLRIRDEARMRIAGYQTLYESSLAFAVRKAVQVHLKP